MQTIDYTVVFLVVLFIGVYFYGFPYLVYLFWKKRNAKIKILAWEFNLNFQDIMPPYNPTYYRNCKNLTANRISGTIGGHTIEISDIYYNESEKNLKDSFKYTHTEFKVVGIQKMEIKNQLALRSLRIASIQELRADLKKLL